MQLALKRWRGQEPNFAKISGNAQFRSDERRRESRLFECGGMGVVRGRQVALDNLRDVAIADAADQLGRQVLLAWPCGPERAKREHGAPSRLERIGQIRPQLDL